MKKTLRKNQSGQVIITAVVFFLVISVTILVGIASPIALQVRNGADYLQTQQGYVAADSLTEEALYRLNEGRTLPASLVLSFSNSTSTALITDVGGAKQVIATGAAGTFSRVSKAVFSEEQGISINYGLQVGNGGVSMSGSSGVTGNLYANGNISGSGSCYVTGSATAAVTTTQVSDQLNSASGTPAINMVFGTTTASQDVAQSFQVSTTTSFAEVMVYIKKTGSPSNATVKVLTDNAGSPSNSTALTSGTLSASLVTTSYGWVTVAFATNPSFVPGTTYWLVIDNASNSTTNYYAWASTIGNAYTSGQLKRGQVGSTWTSPNTAYDAFFQIYLGGVSSISGISVGGSGGDVRAFSVTNTTASGNLYCQSGTGNNKVCNTSQPTSSSLTFPFSDANVQDWKDSAAALGTRNGDLTLGGSVSTTTNGMKINGNLTVGASARLILNGPLYVTGTVTVSGAGRIQLNSTLGASSSYIVSDGKMDISASGALQGSGNAASYLVLVTTSGCGGTTSCSGTAAVTVSGDAGAVVLLAPNGRIDFTGSARAKGAVAYGMSLTGSTNLIYESGLTDINFTSGPSGAWSVDTWKEIAQ
jgi:hypothetical protein